MAEGLFDDDSAPVLIFSSISPTAAKLFDDGTEKVGSGGQVEEIIAVGGMVAVDLVENLSVGIKLLSLNLP